MREDYFNPATYMVIDRVTGVEVDIDIYIKESSSSYWEKAYAKVLAEYIEVTGNNSSKVLAAILKKKNSDNLVLSTVREMAEELDVSPVTVSKIFVALQSKGLMKKIRNGRYLVSPMMLRHGSKTKGALLLRLWGEIK